MKTRIIALAFMAGLFATRALADNSMETLVAVPATFASTTPLPNLVASKSRLPGAAELAGVDAVHGFTGSPVLTSEGSLNDMHLTFDGQAIAFSHHSRALPKIGPVIPARLAVTLAYSLPPSPGFDRGPNDPALWYPSVLFRFDFGRRHGS